MRQGEEEPTVYPTEEELREDLRRAVMEAAAVLEQSSLGACPAAGFDEDGAGEGSERELVM